MASLNKVMLIGHLGADPDIREKGDTVFGSARIATSRKYKNRDGEVQEETEWTTLALWGRTAELFRDYLKKGSQIYVEGRLRTRKWTDKDGKERWSTEVVAENLQFLDKREADERRSKKAAPKPQSAEDEYPF